MRIAAWSGPRNISTAMMRSFENRSDAWVTDEPLYAVYLEATGLDHPLREQIIASQPSDWRRVTAHLAGPIPQGRTVWYQKHMTHHLLPHVGRQWLAALHHLFLIRDPAAVVASYHRRRGDPVLSDLGFEQQHDLYRYARDVLGQDPPVLDAEDVLRAPRTVLGAACDVLGLPFDDAMLAWPPGARATDGVWGSHWYDRVRASTGFAPPRATAPEVPAHLAAVVEAALPHYEALRAYRIAG